MRSSRAQLAGIMLPFALSLLVVLAIVALVRWPGGFSPALVMEAGSSWPGTPSPTAEGARLPATDPPPRGRLPGGGAAVAVARGRGREAAGASGASAVYPG